MRVVSKITAAEAPSQQVYTWLSNLENLRPLVENLRSRAPQLPMGIQVDRIDLTPDSVTVSLGGKGEFTLSQVDAQPFKLLKYASTQGGKDVCLWVQLLEKTPGVTHLRLTMELEVPFFIRKMVEGKIKEALDHAADVLPRLPYNG
ncbi:MAG: hypothetical protein J6Z12_04900 [Paludibacteraceae bacterium]|nr:hypothetical protein [Paludibacteraceae bacterium]